MTSRMNILVTWWLVATTQLFAQVGSPSVPGDHFSLEGALELFKASASPEDFEQRLNSADARVNNLDLNGDGEIDYIRVIDRQQGPIHIFILQAVVSPREYQDVAVIELEKLADGRAVLQITGDADIYGVETIIEPTEEVRIMAGTQTTRTVVNVWTWPSVQYIYSPYYVVWESPWHWQLRPMWWRPWRPVTWVVYRPWWEPYRVYYSSCHYHRVASARYIYYPHRSTSVAVVNRHRDQLDRYRANQTPYRGRDSYNRNEAEHSRGRSSNSNPSTVRRQGRMTDSHEREEHRDYRENRGRQESNFTRPSQQQPQRSVPSWSPPRVRENNNSVERPSRQAPERMRNGSSTIEMPLRNSRQPSTSPRLEQQQKAPSGPPRRGRD